MISISQKVKFWDKKCVAEVLACQGHRPVPVVPAGPPPSHQHTRKAFASDERLVTVNDEMCPDTDFYNYLENQKKIREAEIRKLTQNRNFGFKPKNIKPLF